MAAEGSSEAFMAFEANVERQVEDALVAMQQAGGGSLEPESLRIAFRALADEPREHALKVGRRATEVVGQRLQGGARVTLLAQSSQDRQEVSERGCHEANLATSMRGFLTVLSIQVLEKATLSRVVARQAACGHSDPGRSKKFSGNSGLISVCV